MENFEIEEIDGTKTYKASVSISGKMLTVTNFELGSKSASISANNKAMAKIMLRELINQSKGHGWGR